ncbi:MAG: hypothetical protein AB7E55_24710 [Pigmentiphaga sp.]
MVREHNDRAWLAWHVAALQRADKLPKLKTLLHREKSQAPQRKSWQEQLAIARQWETKLQRLG